MSTSNPAQLLEDGMRHHNAGKLQEAAACYARVLALDPQHADALQLAGVVAHQQGRQDEAERLIQAAIDRRPEVAAYHLNLGNVHQEQARLNEAEADYRRALALQNDFFWAWNNLGNVLGKLDRNDEAIACLERALTLNPGSAATLSNLGSAYRRTGALNRAVDAYHRALQLDNRRIEAWYNLGNVLFETNDLDAADEAYRATALLDPQHPTLTWNWSLVTLARGDLVTGWQRYEQRWVRPEVGIRRRFDAPPWSGETLAGRTIAIWGEQGVGDEILFANVLPDIIAEAGHCIVECDARLVPLFSRSFPTSSFIGRKSTDSPSLEERQFDFHVALGSLPLRYRRSLDAFPVHTGYLRADPTRVSFWRERLAALSPLPKLGISWRSRNTRHRRDKNYMGIADLMPLLQLPGFCFINLQYDDCAEELAWVARELGVTVHAWSDTDLQNDFETSAGLLKALDEIVTPGNAVSALAGALGCKAWRFGVYPDAIATLGQDHSPWFPGLTLAHKTWNAPWTDVTRRLVAGLQK